MLSKSLINMTDFYATLDIAAKIFKNLTHFNNSRVLIMCYKNTENASNIDFTLIPRQNTHLHIISKFQSPQYYYDSININVTIKTTISNHRNETAMIFKQICDAVITSSPISIFSMGTHFTKVIKIIDQHMTDFYATPDLAAKFFKNRTQFNNSKFLINPTGPRCFLNEY